MKPFLIRLIGELLSTTAIQNYVFTAATVGLWYGLAGFSRHLATATVSALFVAVIIYARTR